MVISVGGTVDDVEEVDTRDTVLVDPLVLVEELLLVIGEERGTLLVVMVTEGTSPRDLMMGEEGGVKGEREGERGWGNEEDIVDTVG